MIRKLVIALALALMVTTPALAAGKIGVVNLVTLRAQSDIGKEAERQLQALFGTERQQLESQFAALNQKAEEFNKQATALSEKARAEKIQELQTQGAALENKRMALAQRVAAFEQAINTQMQSVLTTAATNVAKKGNYDMIIDGGAVLYGTDDVTAALLDELNKVWKAQGGKFNLTGIK